MENCLIIIKSDCNDADYIYNHIHTNIDNNVFKHALFVKEYIKLNGYIRYDFFYKFSHRYEVSGDDFVKDEDLEIHSKYVDGDCKSNDEYNKLFNIYRNNLKNLYGEELFEAMSWLNENLLDFDGYYEAHTICEISIYEITKKY